MTAYAAEFSIENSLSKGWVKRQNLFQKREDCQLKRRWGKGNIQDDELCEPESGHMYCYIRWNRGNWIKLKKMIRDY